MDHSLKDEFEAEIRSAHKSKRIILFSVSIASLLLIIICSTVVYAWNQKQAEMSKLTDTNVHNNKTPSLPDNTTEEPSSKSGVDTQTKPTVSNTPPPKAQSESTAQTPYTPTPIPINRDAFIADGNIAIANYSKIVGLVTFTGTVTNTEKISRIRSAVALDKQYFNQVTDLRMRLVNAEVSSGEYMDATLLAEHGVSAISVGLTFMEYWANNNSRISDLNSGLGGVGEGSNYLLQLSQKLDSL